MNDGGKWLTGSSYYQVEEKTEFACVTIVYYRVLPMSIFLSQTVQFNKRRNVVLSKLPWFYFSESAQCLPPDSAKILESLHSS